MKIIATLAAAGVVAGLTAVPAAAQFPDRPITWVVPYTPGGITDTGSDFNSHSQSPAVAPRCSQRTARVRPRAGGGLTRRQTTTTPLRSPFLAPSPFVHRTPYTRATVHR